MKSYALIADADAAAAAVYAVAARDEGLSYVSVRDGSAALVALAERGAPGILVTELDLAHVDGLALIENVRRTKGGEATAVVVVSADREQRDRASALRSRLDIRAVLTKAASLDSIRRILRRLVANAEPFATDVPPPVSDEFRIRTLEATSEPGSRIRPRGGFGAQGPRSRRARSVR